MASHHPGIFPTRTQSMPGRSRPHANTRMAADAACAGAATTPRVAVAAAAASHAAVRLQARELHVLLDASCELLLQPGVLQGLVDGAALCWVRDQHPVQQVLAAGRQALRWLPEHHTGLDCCDRLLHARELEVMCRHVPQGVLPCQHEVQHGACCPDVHADAAAVLDGHLGGQEHCGTDGTQRNRSPKRGGKPLSIA